MALNEKWLVGGTTDIQFGESSWGRTVTVPKAPNSTAEYTYGDYVHDNWPNKAEDQVKLVDASYAYCAADSGFAMQKGVLYNCGYSGYAANRNKKYDLVNEEEMPIGFSHLESFGTYANIGIYGGDRASNKLDDTENTPLNNYLNGKYAKQAGKVYGGGQVPIVRGLTFKDVVVVPIIMSYRLTSGADPAVATKAEMQSNQYRLSSIDAFLNKEYQDFPYVMGVYAAVINVNTDSKTLKVSDAAAPKVEYMINGKWTINIDVYEDGPTPITYYPVYGDENSNLATLDGWYTWNGSQSVWRRAVSMHPYRIMGYYNNGNEWKQPLIRLDGSSPNYSSTGKLILTGDWIKTDMLTVSNSEHWVKIYSERITAANVEAFCEYVRRQIAYLGCVFSCNGLIENMDYRFIDDESYMGVIDGSGKTHGDYTRGLENAKNPQYEWTDPINDTPFVPGGGGKTPTSGGDHDKEQSSYGGDNFSMNNRTMAKFGLHRYVMEEGEFNILMQFYKECLDYKGARKKYIDFLVDKGVSSDDAADLWNAWFPDRSSYLAQMYGDLGYGEDPHKNLVSILALPVDKTEIQGSEENINTGYYTTAKTFTLNTTLRSGASYEVPYAPVTDGFAATAHVLNSTVKVIDLVRDHKIEHPKGWDDFRCYEPYSRCELYIPYHGNVTLSLAQCLNKYITVQVAVDLITGASYAVVLMRGSSGPYAIYQALPGQMGFNVPYSQDSSGYNAGSLMNLSAASQSNKIEKYRNVANSLVATGSAIAGKNAFGAVGSVLGGIATGQQLDVQSDLIDFQIEHSADGRAVANSPSTLTGWAVHQTCQLIWHFPNMLAYNDANYANLVGYATARTGAVGSFKGFTKFNNVNLSALTCLDEERNAIMAALQSGVYL